jgi:hypothetical protein
MMKNPNRIAVPFEQRAMIDPKTRQKVFKEIYEGYASRYGMKLIYAYLNHDPELMVDYGVIYQARNDADTGNLIIYDVSTLYSDRSTPAYKYYAKIKKKDQFFQFGIEEAVVMDRSKFFEYLTIRLDLNQKKGDPRYWKDPENGGELIKGLLDLSLEYVKKDRPVV